MSSVFCLGSSVLLRCTHYSGLVVDEMQLRAVLEPFLARLATSCEIKPSQLVSASTLLWFSWERGIGHVGEQSKTIGFARPHKELSLMSTVIVFLVNALPCVLFMTAKMVCSS